MVSRRLDQIAEVGQLFFDVADLHFVEIAGGLLAIARDERHGSAVVEQFDDGDQAAHGEIERLGDVKEDFRGRGFWFLS